MISEDVKKELLQIAYKKYPVGSKFKSTIVHHKGLEFERKEGQEFKWRYNMNIVLTNSEGETMSSKGFIISILKYIDEKPIWAERLDFNIEIARRIIYE